MATSFFIQFRLQGYAKQYAKWVNALIHREARRLRIRKLRQGRFKPHITLFGPARTHNLRDVITDVERTSRKYTLVPFKVGGFDQFRNADANWLYLRVYPSAELEQLRYELAQSLVGSDRLIQGTCQTYDHGSKYKFHSSIGRYDPRDKDKFKKLVDYAKIKCTLESFRQCKASLLGRLINIIKKYIFRMDEDNPNINLYLLRITVSGKGRREYDLLLKKLLKGRNVWSRYWRRRSIEALKTEINPPPQEERLSISKASKCYFIGDTHFDHKNTIIKFIHRPFSSTSKMNEAIKDNWNKTVCEDDTVYFLGDYTGPPPRKLGMYYEKLRYWTGQLKGTKVSILGNHDRNGGCIEFEKSRILHVDHHSFLLIHNPTDITTKVIKARYDWIIHGHVHNNNMHRYPFINGEKKTINVSPEVTNYRPVSLEYLLSLDLDSIRWMRTVDSHPERS